LIATLIIGYGNPLRRDDGAGYIAAERLAEIMSDPQVRVVARQQLTPELAADASETNRLILIDTEVGHDAGRVYNKKVEPSESPTAPFTHNLNPTTLLTCSKSLY
jgi:hydrogenase maturation protease